MSWETTWHKPRYSSCACGKGIVIHRSFSRSNDWFQTDEGYEEDIKCDFCIENYKIEHIVKYYPRPTFKGGGVQDTAYLVPIDMTLNHDTKEKSLYLEIDEKIVSFFEKHEIEQIIDEMVEHKVSTRLKSNNSREVVDLYKGAFNRRRLSDIIIFLRSCLKDYESYEWNFVKMQAHKEKEHLRLVENNEIIKDVLAKSYQLSFIHDINE